MTNDSHPPVGGDDGEVPVSSRQAREIQLASSSPGVSDADVARAA